MEVPQQELTKILQDRFGFERFRHGQEEAITRLLHDQSVLCIHPTGFGKSLLYQLPSVLLPGITVVISPLLALIRDQEQHLNKRFNIPAATLNSDQSDEENDLVRQRVMINQVKILFVAPEQLDHIDRYQFLLNLPVSLVVVDEAHCISTWGHDFRPSYRLIVNYTRALQEKHNNVRVLGLTATASANTEEDIRKQLSGIRPLHVLRESMDRPNISLSVTHAPSMAMKLAACAQLVEQLPGCGLIYCSTRENTAIVGEFLQEQGVNAIHYHAGLPPERKKQLQNDFIQDKHKVLAATNALGMGIDKQNLRFIIHFDIPGSITAYYQEVGRCGRDGQPAQGILLYDPADRRVQNHFIHSSQPKPEEFTAVLETIGQAADPMKLTDIKRKTGLHPTLVLVIITELVEQGFLIKRSISRSQVYLLTEKMGVPDLSRYERQYAIKTKELNKMLGYAERLDECLMEVLRKALGDKQTTSCGHCAVCTDKLPQIALKQDALDSISLWLEKRVVEIPESKIAKMSSGISLINGKVRSPNFVHFMKSRAQPDVVNMGLTDDLLRLLQEQLKILANKRRIGSVIAVPSRTWTARNTLIEWIAQQLEVPSFPNLLHWKEIPPYRQGELKNNDQRRFNVKKMMTVSGNLMLPAGGILLLDDYIGSGNTMKEASRALFYDGRYTNEIIPFTFAQVQWKLGSSGMI